MTIKQMRDYIYNAYPGPKWRARCLRMSTNQVIAIYYSLQSRMDKSKKASQVPKNEAGIQLTIFDLL